MNGSVQQVARAAHAAGICVLPPKQDGSKAPDAGTWTAYQSRRPERSQIERWYRDGTRTGVGVVCGPISGGLELIDFDDGASAWEPFAELMTDNGLGDMWERITNGYTEQTAGGGRHVFLYSAEPTGATKLAVRPKLPHEMHHERDRWQALIETKGTGGYAVIAPTHGAVHPSGGSYTLLRGGLDTIARISAQEREHVCAVARMLDQRPKPLYTDDTTPRSDHSAGDKPGDRYNAATRWEDLLPAHGWRFDHRRGPTSYWTRPGKDRGISATTNYQGNDLLWVFTSSTDLDPDRSYDRFGFFTVMEHSGDFRAAARAVAAQERLASPTRTVRLLPPVRGRRPVINLTEPKVRHAG
jgi:putative DNA primase/helicase